jgi:hypothetical protein
MEKLIRNKFVVVGEKYNTDHRINKFCFVLLCFVLFYNLNYGQNLISNSGFDIELNCPAVSGQVTPTYIQNWYNPSFNATPDYFSKCYDSTGNNYVHIPNNYFTYQNSNSNNYIGLFIYLYPASLHNYREYIQVKLDSFLKEDKYYRMSVWVNKANLTVYNSSLQICISKDSINNNNYGVIDTGINNIVFTTPFINDTLNWMEFSWVFYTGYKDSLKYLTLGNFLRDEHTPLDSVPSTLPFPAGRDAYILIDSISLIPWHGVGIDKLSNLEDINIYPNPVIDYLYIDFDKSKKLFYTLYDISGKLIIDKSILTQSIDVSALDKGMYILEIKDEEGNSIRKKVIKE